MLRRLLAESLLAALADTPVVIVQGSGPSGKTTLVRELLPAAQPPRRDLTPDRTATPRPRAHHFRTHSGQEIDLVLEDTAGRVVAFEIEASRRVRATDFRALDALADHLGDRFVAGALLHCGTERVDFGPRRFALPLSAPWQPRFS